ncbi:MAG: hypothetical protein IT374_15885 [Polyangiaceae bacterium]|nr:hypothetical protein [Polyangiaceae bacterium]
MNPWIFGRRADLAVFVGPTLAGLALAALVPLGVVSPGKLPTWAWVALVVSVDVAHVHSTLFRTYLDAEELRRRPLLYALVPAACLAAGVALYLAGSAVFWRVLAYVAVFHFVRQQAGWVAIYRAKSGPSTPLDRALDDAAIYLSTAVPLLAWHASLPRPFAWFVEGDFVSIPAPRIVVVAGWVSLAITLAAWGVRQLWRARAGLPVSAGKVAVVTSTAVSWVVGIELVDHDLGFTALNVLPHGVPYFVLLHAYATARSGTRPRSLVAAISRRGVVAFVGVLLVIAVVEEAAWDRLVWRDHAELFGWLPELDASSALWLIVPALTLPQSVHYVLDAVLWRRGATGPEQAQALGFAATVR